jgi:FkbM family methyltransferase
MGQFGKYERAEDIPEEERKFYYIMDKYRKLEEIEFVDQLVNGIWTVRLPKFLAEYHSWWDVWEKETHLSMREHLKPGMLLYDIGAFDGWQSAMFSQMVGGAENMALIEPVKEMWSNTKATWDENKLGPPRLSFIGFAGDYNTDQAVVDVRQWPTEPDYSLIMKAIKFKLMHEHKDSTACLMVDKLVDATGMPAALHIDVEGAGLKVLKGAEQTLREAKPLVWIALHPNFMRERFNTEPVELHKFMDEVGYNPGVLLASDHEDHFFFYP